MEKKNDEIIREDHIKGHLDSIDFETMKIIDEQAQHNIFRIDKTNSVGTGFFCLIPFPDQTNRLPVLATCHHVLNKDDIAIGNQICLIFKNGEKKFLKIDKDRKTYTSDEKKYDTTFIEIKKDDGFDINEMIEIDKNLYKENLSEIYAKSSIYITHYPNGKEIKLSFEILQNITEDNYRIFHFCSTKEGSSGSPIINNSKQIIGIHIGFDKELNMNIGSFIGQIINKIKFNKDDNKQNVINEIRNKDDKEESVISNIKNYDLDYEDPIPKKIENVPSNKSNSGMELMTPELISAVLKNPALIQMGANLYSNPELVKSLSQMPQIQNMMEQNPFMKIGIENPQLVQQIMTPQNIQFFTKFFQPKSPNEN